MEMNILSSNDNETTNHSLTSHRALITASGSLQSEWENFEKSLECSSPPHSSDGITCESSKSDDSNNLVDTDINKPLLVKDKEKQEEEDESHLPPGVRKNNICHINSDTSSDSEDEVTHDNEKDHSDMSCSDESDTSPNHSKIKSENKSELKKPENRTSRHEKQRRNSKKVKHSRSSSGSRSPSPDRRRKSHGHQSHRRSRSRSRSRHHKTDRKHRSYHSQSKEKRKSNERGHRHVERKYNHEQRGSDREWRSNRDKSRRSRSRDRQNGSPGPRGAKLVKFGDKNFKPGVSFGPPPGSKPMTFKEKMRQQLIKAIEEGGDVSQAFTNKDGTSICTQSAGTQSQTTKKPTVPFGANLANYPPGLAPAVITAAENAMQSMLALQKEATEKTGVEIPKYYNPAAINPMRYAEQVQKRKLLWSKNKETEVISQWHATTLSNDHDDKSKEKFRKLMGIKSEGGEDGDKASEEVELKQREMFDKLDKEYQYARMATHTQRGVGFGFGSSSFSALDS